MVTLLITSVLVLGLLAIAIYFWQKPAKTSETIELLAPEQPPRGLFSDFRVNELRAPTAVHPSETAAKLTAQDFDQAIKAIRDFQQSPDRNSTSKLLHVAALSDNPKNYERAIELVLLSWRDGSLNDLSAVELQSVINSEYWVLSSRTRISGAGFVLKQTLSNANRELETRHNPK
jgi:hypothetical protein